MKKETGWIVKRIRYGRLSSGEDLIDVIIKRLNQECYMPDDGVVLVWIRDGVLQTETRIFSSRARGTEISYTSVWRRKYGED